MRETGGRLPNVYHHTLEDVKRCFATEGGILTLEDEHFAAEAAGEVEAERGFERWLEDGGPHAAAIQAEDEIERRLEAQDVGLQQMRDQRAELLHVEEYASALAEKAYQDWCASGIEPTIKVSGIDAWADSVQARAVDLYWDRRIQDREREEDERVAADKAARDAQLFR
jgi:hypothetical protein